MTLTSGLAPVREQLANGVTLIVAQTPTRPAVTISAAMAAGSLWDPSGAEGTAHLLSRVLDRAAGTRTADEMADVLNLYGVSPTITVSRHTTTVSCDCLAEDIHSVLGLVGDMLQAPACVDADVELCRGQVLTGLREDEDSPATRALEAVMPLLYGAQHLYGWATKGSPATVEPITPSPLLDFHAARFGPDRLTLVMVGDITVSAAVAAGLTRSSRRRSHCPRRQGADGASFRCLRNRRRISCTGSRRSCDQTLRSTLTVMNNVLGQYGIGGRLAQSIRERQGMAYYAGSVFEAGHIAGPLLVRAGGNGANVDRAVGSIETEVAGLARDSATDEEVTNAKRYLCGAMPRSLETNAGIARFLQAAHHFDLSLDHDRRLPGLVDAVTVDSVAESARRSLVSEQAALVIAGPYEGS
jgi:zinc protease